VLTERKTQLKTILPSLPWAVRTTTTTMGVDHRVDRETCPPTFRSRGDVMCFVPLLFEDLLNNDCFSIAIKHNKSHLTYLAAGLRSDALGGDRTYGTYETPAFGNRERVLKKVGQKRD